MQTVIKDSQTIVDFLRGLTKDYKGRTFNDIVACDDWQMELCHDQIQWMFPLHEESKFAEVYPILTKETVDLANKYPVVKENLRKALERMRKFYGIGKFHEPKTQKLWCHEFNHNLLRITRIIRCLRIFELSFEAYEFYKEVYDVGSGLGISEMTIGYWKKALSEDI